MVPVLIIIAIQFRRRILVEFRYSRKANSRITAAFNETITGVRVVKALGKETENLSEFKGLTGEMFRRLLPGSLALGSYSCRPCR